MNNNNPNTKRNYFIVCIIFLVFFVISFLTNILGALNPTVSKSFHLSDTMAGFLPFAFFIAYGILSIPSGIMVEKWGGKKMVILAFFLALIGSLMVGFFPNYPIFIVSLFIIGAGMAALQVVINPLLRVSGGEENFAFTSVLAQLIFGLASFVSPRMYSYLVSNIDSENLEKPFIGLMTSIVPESLSWISVYWVFAVISLVMIGLIALTKFPKVTLKEDERVGSKTSFLELIKNKYVILYFLGIFAYVGTEQGISFWMSKFLNTYHGIDSDTLGADAVSYFWLFMTIGGLVGLVCMRLFDSKLVLRIFTFSALILLALGLFGGDQMALWCLPLTGFSLSVMYPSIVSLGLNSVEKHHGSFAGILMSGIAGGAIVQLLIGGISDVTTLKTGMLFIFITLGYILSISFWAKPIVSNKTIRNSKKERN